MRGKWVAAAGLLWVGCGGEIEPETGEWMYANEVIIDNTCTSAIDYTPTEGSFFLDNDGGGSFTVDPNDGGEVFDCTLDGKDYDCPERLRENIELGVGATAEVTGTVSGRFDSNTEAEGTQTATLACRDAGCQTLASLAGIPDPCSITVEFDAVFEE